MRLNKGIEARLGRRAVLIAPLLFGQTIVGSIGFHYASEGRTFTESDAAFATQLAALIALALENSRRYALERQIATTLQSALLTTPRRIPGLDFGYLYRSATEAASVGGDFYDLIELDANRAGLLIGDVSGKGIAAAHLTALVKNTVRALAYDTDSPAGVLARASDIVLKSTPAWSFVTVLFCILDLDSGHLVYCSAGHPHAILRRRGGSIEMLDVGSVIAGAFADSEYVDAEIEVGEGDLLVLYTDGVTEARRDHDMLGEAGLVEFVEEIGAAPTREVPQALFDRLLDYTGGQLSDDVAIVAVSRVPISSAARRTGA